MIRLKGVTPEEFVRKTFENECMLEIMRVSIKFPTTGPGVQLAGELEALRRVSQCRVALYSFASS